MTFTSDTIVQSVPDRWKQAQTYQKGDPISAASSSGTNWSWTTSSVVFASHAGAQEPSAVYIRFAGGELVVSNDQPMMTKGGVLKRANALDPEADSLTGPDGSTVPLISITLGIFRGLFCALVATSEQWEGKVDGHLLNCAGVVCGDYLVQMYLGDDRNASR